MKDTDYTTILLAVWIAPVMAKDQTFIWYVMLVLFLGLHAVAGIKTYYERKADKLRAELERP